MIARARARSRIFPSAENRASACLHTNDFFFGCLSTIAFITRSYLLPRGLPWDTCGIIFSSHDISRCAAPAAPVAAAALSIATGRNEFLFDNDFPANHTWLCFIGNFSSSATRINRRLRARSATTIMPAYNDVTVFLLRSHFDKSDVSSAPGNPEDFCRARVERALSRPRWIGTLSAESVVQSR